jgi:Secretion system C-terminal sorting domain
MKPNYYVLLLSFTFIFSIESRSQAHCSTILTTTAPTISAWDWRAQVWQTNIYSTLSGQVNSVVSPFHAIRGANLDNGSNKNIFSFVENADKDNKPEDGWELITMNLGVPNFPPAANGYAIFYNKYTAKLRAFFLVTQLFSEIGTDQDKKNNDEKKGGLVKISFVQSKNRNQAYQSNLLTSYTSPLLPLDKFKRDANIITPNAFNSTLPYWLYADFPVAYDPCTCSNQASITIECSLINTAKVDVTINSLPYNSPIQSDAVNKDGDFLQGFSSFSGKVEGGLKSVTKISEASSILYTAITKQSNPEKLKKLNADFNNLSNSLQKVSNFASLIPVAGSYVSAVTSLIDMFSGGGNSTPAGPAPTMIMNDFKATGTITSSYPKNTATFYLPGSDQTGKDAALAPYYNNILGSFNLLHTPSIAIKYKHTDRLSPEWDGHTTKEEYWFSVNPTIPFVINPALDIDLSKSTIRAAYLLEGLERGQIPVSEFTNLQVDIEKSGSPIYRSSYYPLGTISEGSGYLGFSIETGGSLHYPISIERLTELFTNKLYLKIIAKLHPRNATNPSQDIIFIAKYPANITVSVVTTPTPTPLEDIQEDIYLPDNLPIRDLSSFTALNTISIGSTTIGPLPRPVFFKAGEAIIVREGAAITPLHSIKVGGIYPSTPSLQSLQATSSDLNNFCGSADYNGKNNERNIASRQAIPEEIQILTKEEFFTFFPNPATDHVTFKYFVEEASQVRLSLVDLSGKPIGLLIDERKEMGDYVHNFDSSDLAAGMYIIKFESDKLNRTEKLVVIK